MIIKKEDAYSYNDRDDMEVETIGSVRTLLEKLEKLKSSSDSFMQSKSVQYYRGHPSKNFQILPSVYRDKNFFQQESRLIREVTLRCPDDFNSSKSAFESLVKMQHYGVPTRLLDITENPLVALYFVCSESIENKQKRFEDGELILFSIPESEIKYYDSDVVTILSNLAWTPEDFSIKKSHINYTRPSPIPEIVKPKLLHNIRLEKPSFTDSIDARDILTVACVKPKLTNPRIIKQSGAFMIFGIGEDNDDKGLYTKLRPAPIQRHWLNNGSNKRFIIPHDKKEKILKQLEQLGITAATLFPELDKVSEYLKKQFLGMESSKPELIRHPQFVRGPKFG
ncbi:MULTISPECIES: FRG domain-containing protein [unclassified Alteromonas]|uniref:FRG domain-containing protein n=1 Tax=unclassified Alteromonas TaxID=2614992 RepID=UPI0016536165|nr:MULTISPECIES: FRG domain-containing protein [unclassified Alteromonas]MBC6987306.1 FRG domain-containing protein [Alteromonas sp. BZK5]MCG7654151.1 FRG domain-containing protein [Alteromonas sp. Cnat2-8]|tara:strand:+ start:292 stop:1305 length:1014 start_codon:yes stop_codon:yes gene_type:complete